jgi:hypothetical protein
MVSFAYLCITPGFCCHADRRCTDMHLWAMSTSHFLFEVALAVDGSELSSKKVSKLSRRYNRLKKKIPTMADDPTTNAWMCPACSFAENSEVVARLCSTVEIRLTLILDEIEDDQFDNESVHEAMRRKYKKAKLDNNATQLWRKYESDLTELRNFAKKLPGDGSLLELPSGSNQLKHMKMPLVQKLWIETHPL